MPPSEYVQPELFNLSDLTSDTVSEETEPGELAQAERSGDDRLHLPDAVFDVAQEGDEQEVGESEGVDSSDSTQFADAQLAAELPQEKWIPPAEAASEDESEPEDELELEDARVATEAWTEPAAPLADIKPVQTEAPIVQEFPESIEADLLDAASLQTVLEMLTVMTSVEELELLETLSLAQKRQVWDATPATVKARLIQIRQSGSLPAPAAPPLPEAPHLQPSAPQLAAIDQSSHAQFSPAEPTPLKPGDWIVLTAQVRLSRDELIAIWQVQEVQPQFVRIWTAQLGMRQYPPHWMLRYPHPPTEPLEESAKLPLEEWLEEPEF